jgi:hypothetical protein
MTFFYFFPTLLYRVIVRCVPYRQFSQVWVFLSRRRLFHSSRYLQRFILLGLLYQYMAWLATLLLSFFLFVSELEEKKRRLDWAGIVYCMSGRCEDRPRSRPSNSPSSSMLLVYPHIRRSTWRPKPQQQQPFSHCRPQKTVRDGQDPLAVTLPRAKDARIEEAQNRAPIFHHVSYWCSYR